ncbi:MAG: shikimate dehydrogenase [Saprospirales bacterium]|nr:MAG: shikimate dehydrogenase [Saprospirales bacterium]
MIKLGLIGRELGHSFSPEYFKKKFTALGEQNEYSYEALEFENWDKAERFIRQSGYHGFNVTIPYKKDAAKFCDYLDHWAEKIKAVNTLVTSPHGKVFGYNTDAPGFLQTLTDREIKVSKALILGSGGAASAISTAIKNQGGMSIIVSRSKKSGDFTYADLWKDESILRSTDIIINCSPIGTYPKTKNSPDIPYHQLNSDQILYDLVYNPPETVFLRRGKKAGCRTINGYEMLCNQADLSWEIWYSFVKEA